MTRIVRVRLAGIAIAVAAIGSVDRPLSAYVGVSFLQIPGVSGGWPGETYTNWIRVEAQYWKGAPVRRTRPRESRAFISGPLAPRQGEGAMVIAIDKGNPVLAPLMDRCANKASLAEVLYAESVDRARGYMEVGPRPADMPAYFEYRLTDVQVSECPVVADAPEQAFVVTFKDIQWLNYRGDGPGKALALAPAVLPPAQASGTRKTFVLHWVGGAYDVTADQCPTMTVKPSEEEYYALMSPAEAAKERARLASKGGPTYADGQFCFRGPRQLNVCQLPGIVRDPGLPAPHMTVARGLNLDGDDGTGEPPAGVRRHTNFVSEDGRSRGIDNQLYTVEGCMTGRAGHKGQGTQYSNEMRRNGLLSMLILISGIDHAQQDDHVDVTLLASKDPMAKNATGADILADYTFRITNNPEYTHYFRRLPGRIVNGVIVVDPVKTLHIHTGFDPLLTLHEAQMRLEVLPDGTLKGLVGGYQDWRTINMVSNASSQGESLYPAGIPAIYHAMKRAADGLKDPVSGEYNGISTAYDIEGIPAFIPSDQLSAVLGHADVRAQKAP